jgi:hypothetical protein
MSEEMVIEYCSPTLAGIKTGNLFSCEYQDKQQLLDEIRSINRVLFKKGIVAVPIRFAEKRALIYLYRPSFLKKDLRDTDAANVLSKLGYEVNDVQSCVRCLQKKLVNFTSCEDFPHEIGFFLGYPADDVKGYLKYRGTCSKCSGLWQVYGDVERAKNIFARYNKCTRDYKMRFQSGMTLDCLAVSK